MKGILTPRRGAGLILLSVLFSFWSCAVNPVTGRHEFMLLSEQEEVQLGTQTDAQIVRQYNLYPDAKLAGYISQMGQRLSKASHRSELSFHFKVLDASVVNAFAVPGGYVYLTRGILAGLNSEAELVGVMGHEIGHITARHSAQQYSRAQVAQVGLGLGAVVGQILPVIGGLTTGLAQAGVGLLFMSFSRDNERQADSLAVEYASRTGYDGGQLAAFFESLERMNPGSDRSGLPSWFSTHPSPENRVQSVRTQARELQKNMGTRDLNVFREEYLQRIEGMIYGEDPRQGYVADGVFYHPELRFQFPIPARWKVNNSPSSVQMISGQKDALILFSLTDNSSPGEAANIFASKSKGEVVRTEAIEAPGWFGQRVVSNHRTSKGDLRLVSCFIRKGKQGYVFHGISPLNLAGQYEPLFTATTSEFRELTAPERINVQPDRIRLRTVQVSQTLEAFLRSSGVPDPKVKEIAFLNGKEPGERVAAGTRIKLVERGRERGDSR
jgi:predicted Zn-dependent protease